jgi:ATP-binding cassette subfamily B (MDR/TAP) protein 1
MTIVMGNLINAFTQWDQIDDQGRRGITPEEFRTKVGKNTLWFVYLFIGKFTLIYLHTTCFTISATRMTRAIRLDYLKAILRQEVAYFDSCTPGSVATRISTNANLIQSGLGEKVGVATQGFAMLGSSYIIAFSQQWKLTLVTSTTLPAVFVLVGIAAFFDQKLEVKILDTQTKAGGLAEEALGSVRNVVAFGAHEKLKAKYDVFLEMAKKFGEKKGPYLGIMYSSQFSIMYCAYALSFWYGIRLLLDGEIKNGGKIVTYVPSPLRFFTVIFHPIKY